VGPSNVLEDAETLLPYNQDWMGRWKGSSPLVLRPSETGQLSEILAFCHGESLAVVPQGGNTGLVGGSIPVYDEIVISLSRMNRILKLDEQSSVLSCQAGCVLQELDEELKERGFMMPLDLGAKGSCQIGGNISTNAGGLRLIRYGSLHANVLGLEVVLANGDVLDLMNTCRKDNTGYDLKQLFVGSEGTLGIVTAVALQVPVKVRSVQVAVLQVPSFAGVLSLLSRAKTELSDILSAYEFMDLPSVELVGKKLDLHLPAELFGGRESDSTGMVVFLETHGSSAEHDQEKLGAFLESRMQEGSVLNGVLAASEQQATDLWKVREDIGVALVRNGTLFKYDISLPAASFYDVVIALRQRLSGFKAEVFGFGHVGDGNLHVNINAHEDAESVLKQIEPFIYEETGRVGGSISAEHGIGMLKKPYLHLSKSDLALHYMREMKKVFDPKGILNPYKII
jgi:D-2-hydroxyglutarate dehydrogenase